MTLNKSRGSIINDITEPESSSHSQFKMMLPDEIRSKLEVAACVNKTSVSKEAIRILQEYFDKDIEDKDEDLCKFSTFPEGMTPSMLRETLSNSLAKVYSLISNIQTRLKRLENKE